jgi:hypothetical protein
MFSACTSVSPANSHSTDCSTITTYRQKQGRHKDALVRHYSQTAFAVHQTCYTEGLYPVVSGPKREAYSLFSTSVEVETHRAISPLSIRLHDVQFIYLEGTFVSYLCLCGYKVFDQLNTFVYVWGGGWGERKHKRHVVSLYAHPSSSCKTSSLTPAQLCELNCIAAFLNYNNAA